MDEIKLKMTGFVFNKKNFFYGTNYSPFTFYFHIIHMYEYICMNIYIYLYIYIYTKWNGISKRGLNKQHQQEGT